MTSARILHNFCTISARNLHDFCATFTQLLYDFYRTSARDLCARGPTKMAALFTFGNMLTSISFILANTFKIRIFLLKLIRFIKFLITPEHLIQPSGAILIFMRSISMTPHVVALLPALTFGNSLVDYLEFFDSSLPVSFLAGSLLGSTTRHAAFPSAEDQLPGEEFFSPYYYCCRVTSNKIRDRSVIRRHLLLPPSTSPASASAQPSANPHWSTVS